MIKVSVIVPVYNMEAYLDRCMESLLNQTLTDIEIILGDDGSQDRTPGMCDAYASRPGVSVVHKKNGGLGLARNSGLDVAQGEFVTFVDSDDYVERTMYETLWSAAQKHRADAVYGGYYKETPYGQTHPVTICREEAVFSDRQHMDAFLLDMVGTEPEMCQDFRCGPSVWKVLYKRDVIERHGLRFASEREFISEDLLFNMDFLALAQRVAVLPDCLYHYCYNSASLSKSYRKERFDRDKILYYEVCRRLAQNFPAEAYQPRADRMLFGRARVALGEEVRAAAPQYGAAEARAHMRKICQDATMQELYTRFPAERLPRKYRVIFQLMKRNAVLPLYGLLWLKERSKRA